MSGDIAGLYGGAVPTDQPDAATGFDLLPPGWYPVELEAAEIKPTRAGTGKFLKIKLTVIGERFGNRKLFVMINLVNPNPKAVEIGMRELAGLGQACGLTAISDTQELLGKQFDARVKVKKGNAGYDDDNAVSAYAPLGTKSSGQATQQQAAPPAQAPAAGKRPWEK